MKNASWIYHGLLNGHQLADCRALIHHFWWSRMLLRSEWFSKCHHVCFGDTTTEQIHVLRNCGIYVLLFFQASCIAIWRWQTKSTNFPAAFKITSIRYNMVQYSLMDSKQIFSSTSKRPRVLAHLYVGCLHSKQQFLPVFDFVICVLLHSGVCTELHVSVQKLDWFGTSVRQGPAREKRHISMDSSGGGSQWPTHWSFSHWLSRRVIEITMDPLQLNNKVS